MSFNQLYLIDIDACNKVYLIAMVTPRDQLDKRFAEIRPFVVRAVRPARGWVRAIREALGMTTAQMAARMGVTQPRVVELEKSEPTGAVTLQSLERAAEALGCHLVYVLVPRQPLTQTVRARAIRAAEKQFAAIEQTMRLEDQTVDPKKRIATRERLITELMQKPARLWDS